MGPSSASPPTAPHRTLTHCTALRCRTANTLHYTAAALHIVGLYITAQQLRTVQYSIMFAADTRYYARYATLHESARRHTRALRLEWTGRVEWRHDTRPLGPPLRFAYAAHTGPAAAAGPPPAVPLQSRYAYAVSLFVFIRNAALLLLICVFLRSIHSAESERNYVYEYCSGLVDIGSKLPSHWHIICIDHCPLSSPISMEKQRRAEQ